MKLVFILGCFQDQPIIFQIGGLQTLQRSAEYGIYDVLITQILFSLMTMRNVCSWKHQCTSEKMSIEDIPYGVYFLCGKSKPLVKKLPLHQLLCYVQIGQAGHRRKQLFNFVKTKQNSPSELSCSTEKYVRYARPIGRR